MVNRCHELVGVAKCHTNEISHDPSMAIPQISGFELLYVCIIFHQPEMRWLGGYSPHKPPFGVNSVLWDRYNSPSLYANQNSESVGRHHPCSSLCALKLAAGAQIHGKRAAPSAKQLPASLSSLGHWKTARGNKRLFNSKGHPNTMARAKRGKQQTPYHGSFSFLTHRTTIIPT